MQCACEQFFGSIPFSDSIVRWQPSGVVLPHPYFWASLVDYMELPPAAESADIWLCTLFGAVGLSVDELYLGAAEVAEVPSVVTVLSNKVVEGVDEPLVVLGLSHRAAEVVDEPLVVLGLSHRAAEVVDEPVVIGLDCRSVEQVHTAQHRGAS